MKDLSKRQFYSLLAIASIIYVIGLILFGNYMTFVFDDICQINMVNVESLKEAIERTRFYDNNPPLSHLFTFFWIKLVPFSALALKLPNILFVAVGMVLCGLLVGDRYGYTCGLITAAAGFSIGLMVERAAYTFRPYGLYFFSSAWVLYLFYKRYSAQNKRSTSIWYVISLIILLYSHYFGAILLALLFVEDCSRYFKASIWRKGDFKEIILIYLIPEICIVPWLLYAFMNSLSNLDGFWPSEPGVLELFGTIPLLLDFDLIIIAITIFQVIRIIIHWSAFEKERMLVLIPTCMLLLIFAFSRIASGSIWVTRYFMCLVPVMLVLFGGGVHYLLDKVYDCIPVWLMRSLILGFFIYCFVNNGCYLYHHANNAANPYELVAENLNAQTDLRADDVIIWDQGIGVSVGWEYLLTEKGRYTMPNLVSEFEDISEDIQKVYVIHPQHPDEELVDEELIKSGFELLKIDENLPISIYCR